MPTNPNDIQSLAGDPLASPDFQVVTNVYNISLIETVTLSDAFHTPTTILLNEVLNPSDTFVVVIPSTLTAQDVQPLAGAPEAAPDFPDIPLGTTYNVSINELVQAREIYNHNIIARFTLSDLLSPLDTSHTPIGVVTSLSDTLAPFIEIYQAVVSHPTFPSFGRGVRLPFLVRMVDKIRMK